MDMIFIGALLLFFGLACAFAAGCAKLGDKQ
jgi:hypothetical protein